MIGVAVGILTKEWRVHQSESSSDHVHCAEADVPFEHSHSNSVDKHKGEAQRGKYDARQRRAPARAARAASRSREGRVPFAGRDGEQAEMAIIRAVDL